MKHTKLSFLLLALGIAILAGCSQGPSAKYYKSVPPELDALCQRAIDEWKVPGMAVAVVKDGEVVFLKGFGNAVVEDDFRKSEPVTPQTQFVIASTSKAFTSALLANVMDEYPEIKWNAPVINYLPDFKLYDPWATKNFQVREIMCHHTGWKTYAMDDMPFFGYGRDELYEIFSGIQPSYSFRTTYAYNNEMYTVAAKIIEKYTGLSWDEAIAQRIFKPLQMNNSTTGNVSFFTSATLAKPYRVTKDYDSEEDVIIAVPRTDAQDAFTWMSAVAPAAFVMTTAEDMTHWLKMHLNHGIYNGDTIVSRKNHDMLFYPQTITSCDSTRLTNYAQGWTIEQGVLGRYIRHTGLAYGYTSLVGLVPDLDLGFVFLTNNGSDSDAQSGIARDLIALYRGEKKPHYFDEYIADFRESLFKKREPREKEAVDSVAPLSNKAYLGTYKLEPFGKAKVYQRGDSLFFQHRDVDSYMQHKNGNTFIFRVPGAGRFDLTFSADKNGRVKSLTFDINDPIGEFIKQ